MAKKKPAKKPAAKPVETKTATPVAATENATATETTETTKTIVPKVPRQVPLKSFAAIQPAKDAAVSSVTEEVVIQHWGKDIASADVVARARENYAQSGATAAITSLKAYVKPEESMVYYVINDEFQGFFEY